MDQEKLGWEHNVAPVVATTHVDDDDDWDNDTPVQGNYIFHLNRA